jgi:hypothetical protein
MLMHLVCFKYKSTIGGAERDQHRARLQALRDIDGIVDLKVGEDTVRSARSYDTGLAIMFRDREALDAYQTHPDHMPVAKLGVASCESIVSVDFDV